MKKILPIGLIIILIIGVGVLFFGKQGTVAENCPDPTCTAPTSTTTDTTVIPSDNATTTNVGASSTKTFADVKQKVSFDYVDNFYFNNDLTQYVHPVEWPPQVTVTTEKFVCKTESKKIGSSNYCVTVESEGAAGSTYTTYTYKKAYGAKTVSLTFIIRIPQCMNFDEPNQTNCKNEVKNFSIDNLIDGIFKTVKFQ